MIPLVLMMTAFFSADGKPVSGGHVYVYKANSSILSITWIDSQRRLINVNPVALDSHGAAGIYCEKGTYRIVLKDKAGVIIWTEDNIGNPFPIVVRGRH